MQTRNSIKKRIVVSEKHVNDLKKKTLPLVEITCKRKVDNLLNEDDNMNKQDKNKKQKVNERIGFQVPTILFTEKISIDNVYDKFYDNEFISSNWKKRVTIWDNLVKSINPNIKDIQITNIKNMLKLPSDNYYGLSGSFTFSCCSNNICKSSKGHSSKDHKSCNCKSNNNNNGKTCKTKCNAIFKINI